MIIIGSSSTYKSSQTKQVVQNGNIVCSRRVALQELTVANNQNLFTTVLKANSISSSGILAVKAKSKSIVVSLLSPNSQSKALYVNT